jgi:uncharacterized protein (DUF58 family)
MRSGLKSKYYDPEKLAGIKNLQLLARTVVEGYISGLHRSPFKGFSAEFAEYREYLPGDDLKHFDWKVYARSDKRYIKQYEEETNLACTVLLDASGSMAFGRNELTKWDYGASLAAALAYLMIQQRDQVGLVVFDQEVQLRIPPRNSPAHLKTIIERIEQVRPMGTTGIGVPLHAIAETTKRRGLVVLISDLLDEPDQVVSALNHFRHNRNEVLVFHLLDPAERELEYDGLIEFQDMETGRRMQVRPDVVREEYQKHLEAFLQRYRRDCAAARVDYEIASTDFPYELMLARYLSRRGRMR